MRRNDTGRPADKGPILSGARGPSNPAHDSPSKPGTLKHKVDVRPRVIKSPRPAPGEAQPKADSQKPDKPIRDNSYPGLPHVNKRNLPSPKKAATDVWPGVAVDIPQSKSLGKASGTSKRSGRSKG